MLIACRIVNTVVVVSETALLKHKALILQGDGQCRVGTLSGLNKAKFWLNFWKISGYFSGSRGFGYSQKGDEVLEINSPGCDLSSKINFNGCALYFVLKQLFVKKNPSLCLV